MMRHFGSVEKYRDGFTVLGCGYVAVRVVGSGRGIVCKRFNF